MKLQLIFEPLKTFSWFLWKKIWLPNATEEIDLSTSCVEITRKGAKNSTREPGVLLAHAYNPSIPLVKKEDQMFKASLGYIKLHLKKTEWFINNYTWEKVKYELLKIRQIKNTLEV